MHSRQYVNDALEVECVEKLGRFIDLLAAHVWREVLGDPERMEMMSDANLSGFQKKLVAEVKKPTGERDFAFWTGERFAGPMTP